MLITLARTRPLGVDPDRPFPGVPAGSIRETYWRLIRQGESPEVAADLTAFILGLPIATETTLLQWTVDQIAACLFLRWLYETGR